MNKSSDRELASCKMQSAATNRDRHKKTQHQHRNAKITNAVAGTRRCRTTDINWLLPEGSENATFLHIDSCMLFGWIPVAIPASCCYSRAYPFKKYRALPVRFFFMLGSAA